MHLISILISGRKFKFPISLEEKSPNNSTGLCNQIFEVINTIYLKPNNIENIYFDLFSKDYISGDLLKLSDILDIKKMNSVNDWNLYDLIDFKGGEIIIKYIGYVFQAHNEDLLKFIDISRSLIFNYKYESVAKKIIKNLYLDKEEVNLVHLRIDKDVEDHISRTTGGFKNYVELYKKVIFDNCSTDMKLVILLEDTNHKLVKELSEKYNIIFFDKDLVLNIYNNMYDDNILQGREMYALIDLLIGKNLKINNYICAQGKTFTSSFSVLLRYISDNKKTITI